MVIDGLLGNDENSKKLTKIDLIGNNIFGNVKLVDDIIDGKLNLNSLNYVIVENYGKYKIVKNIDTQRMFFIDQNGKILLGNKYFIFDPVIVGEFVYIKYVNEYGLGNEVIEYRKDELGIKF